MVVYDADHGGRIVCRTSPGQGPIKWMDSEGQLVVYDPAHGGKIVHRISEIKEQRMIQWKDSENRVVVYDPAQNEPSGTNRMIKCYSYF